ncbi:unnamed protein product [Heterobilharzia americana]|nr:unnamed protein product [Heterobilharzia americana]
MTCCPKSKLNVIMAAFSGCFVQLSPLEWCIEVPSKLYGCPNLCFKYVLDNLEKYPDEVNKAGKSLRKRDENYFSSQQASEGTIQEAPNPKGRTQLIESSAHHHREQQVQTSSLLCRNDSQTQTMSGTSEEVNTTDSSSLNNSPSENHCHHHCEHNTCLGWPQKCVGNKFNQSRYRAARSFINGRSQLDWWLMIFG